MTAPHLFLIVSVIGALFTLNALRPPRHPEVLSMFFFFASWLTAELPYHHLAWQAIATVVFIAVGALHGWQGWAGLGLTLASWAGLLLLAARSRASAQGFEDSMRKVLGHDYLTRVDAARSAGWGAPLQWRQLARPLPLRPAAGVTKLTDIAYAEPGDRAHRLDVYKPADGRTKCPTLLFIHGGAWIIGDKREQGIPMMNRLAAHGWVCMTANYRLSPKAAFPAHLLDVKQALRWIREHGAEHGADPSFVVVSGGSAGGHLGALMALTANDPRYQPGFEDVDTSVQGAALFYGQYDFTNRLKLRSKGSIRFFERMIMKKKLADDPAAFAAASPIDQIGDHAPPMLIIHGSNDILIRVEEARYFADLVAKASRGPVVYAEVSGAQHAFDIFPSVRAMHVIAGVERYCDYIWSLEMQRRGARTS